MKKTKKTKKVEAENEEVEAKIIGYIRVSTDKQNLENQKSRILDYAHKEKIIIDEFIEIEISSRKNERLRKIDELKEMLNKNDTLVVTELSRLGRNMIEVLALINYFTDKEVGIIFVNQPELSTKKDNAMSGLMLAIYSFFAETEREMISQRTKQALKALKDKKVKLGRKKGAIVKSKYDVAKEKIFELHNLGLSTLKICNYIGFGTQQGVYSYIKAIKKREENKLKKGKTDEEN